MKKKPAVPFVCLSPIEWDIYITLLCDATWEEEICVAAARERAKQEARKVGGEKLCCMYGEGPPACDQELNNNWIGKAVRWCN